MISHPAPDRAAAAKAAEEEQQRMEAARQELAAMQAAALEEAKQTGLLRMDGQTADAYAGVTPDGRPCHHRHRSPEAAAECAAQLAKAA